MQEQGLKIFSIVSLFMVLILFGCEGDSTLPLAEEPPSVPKVSISPTSGTVSTGATFIRTVEVKDVGNIFFAAFDVTYDPNVVEFVDATEGSFLSRDGSDLSSIQVALHGGEQGRLVVGLTRLGQIEEVSGTGILLSLTFKALGPGTTTLTLVDPKAIRNSANQDIVIDAWENATVTVQ